MRSTFFCCTCYCNLPSLAAMVLFGLGLAVTTVGLTVFALAVIQVSYRKKQRSSPQR